MRVLFGCGILHGENTCLDSKGLGISDLPVFKSIRGYSVQKVQETLPSPHSELLLGMVLGVDNFKYVPKFKNILKTTGTIHVVVVSGFNMTLVLDYVSKLVGNIYSRKKLTLVILMGLFYTLLTGFEPPVVRAWLMSTFILIGKFFGRSLDPIRLLLTAFLFILLIDPSNLFSISNYLSFLATFGLMAFAEPVQKLIDKLLPKIKNSLEDFSASLSAQITVWPLLSGIFGQVSLISLPVNGLILWTVPVATVLGSLSVICFLLHVTFLGRLLALLTYPFLDLFVRTVEIFSKVSFASVRFTLSQPEMVVYYVFLLLATIAMRKRKG